MKTNFEELTSDNIVHARETDRRAWQIVLLAVTAPIWLSVGIALFSAAFGLFLGLFGAVIGTCAAAAGLIIGGLAAPVGAIFAFFNRGTINGLFTLGAGLGCLGIGLLLFSGSIAAAKGVGQLIKSFILWIHNFQSR